MRRIRLQVDDGRHLGATEDLSHHLGILWISPTVGRCSGRTPPPSLSGSKRSEIGRCGILSAKRRRSLRGAARMCRSGKSRTDCPTVRRRRKGTRVSNSSTTGRRIRLSQSAAICRPRRQRRKNKELRYRQSHVLVVRRPVSPNDRGKAFDCATTRSTDMSAIGSKLFSMLDVADHGARRRRERGESDLPCVRRTRGTRVVASVHLAASRMRDVRSSGTPSAGRRWCFGPCHSALRSNATRKRRGTRDPHPQPRGYASQISDFGICRQGGALSATYALSRCTLTARWCASVQGTLPSCVSIRDVAASLRTRVSRSWRISALRLKSITLWTCPSPSALPSNACAFRAKAAASERRSSLTMQKGTKRRSFLNKTMS